MLEENQPAPSSSRKPQRMFESDATGLSSSRGAVCCALSDAFAQRGFAVVGTTRACSRPIVESSCNADNLDTVSIFFVPPVNRRSQAWEPRSRIKWYGRALPFWCKYRQRGAWESHNHLEFPRARGRWALTQEPSMSDRGERPCLGALLWNLAAWRKRHVACAGSLGADPRSEHGWDRRSAIRMARRKVWPEGVAGRRDRKNRRRTQERKVTSERRTFRCCGVSQSKRILRASFAWRGPGK